MIEPAHGDEGPEILEITAVAGVFKPTEVETVAEIWSEFVAGRRLFEWLLLPHLQGKWKNIGLCLLWSSPAHRRYFRSVLDCGG